MNSANGTHSPFLSAYANALTNAAGKDYVDNYDWRRFGPEQAMPSRSAREQLFQSLLGIINRKGLVRLADLQEPLNTGLHFALPHAAELDWLFRHLEDDESRNLLVQLIAFRALGYRRVKLPLSRPDHWKLVEAMERKAEGCESMNPGFLDWRLPKLDLRELGYPIELFYRPDGAVVQFVHQQYRCLTAQGAIEAKEGDVVIDAGGCWGDTALYFSSRVGSRGKVFSYEFLPDNLKVYHRNLELNPELAARIELLPHPVWSSGDVELFISQNGPGTTVAPTRAKANDKTVRTRAIDQLLEDAATSRIDFVKMDIEGAELQALRGAETVLRRFRPKLAITVYHSLSDFWEIPQYLDALGLGYRFFLRHFTIHAEETVLFASCEAAE